MAVYDSIADWYELDYLARWAGRDPLDLHRTLRGLLGPGSGTCLEIGCGTGVRAEHVAALGWQPIGVDVSAGMLRHSRGRLPVARADAVRLPFADASMAAVITVMVHTDLPDYPATLVEAARVLVPGGVLVHVGVHPCFVGDFADLREDESMLIRPGYLEAGRTRRSWTGRGVRHEIEVMHRPLPAFLHAFLDAGLTLDRFAEGGSPVPAILGVRARKPAA